MDFLVRPVEERDFPACLDLLRGHLAYPASILPELPKVWRRLLREDALVTAVAESGSLDSRSGPIPCTVTPNRTLRQRALDSVVDSPENAHEREMHV